MSVVIPFLSPKIEQTLDLTTIKDLEDADKYIIPSTTINDYGAKITSPHEVKVVRFNTESEIGSLTDYERGIVNLIGYISSCIQKEMDNIFNKVPTFKLRLYVDLLNSKHLNEIADRISLFI